ncbi:MAG TPA: glycoside hydrolase family 97 protein [Ohtaekwangia sp.]|nr:glycoside hydrolase family 97 protein [Ohtaekwangia sp.]
MKLFVPTFTLLLLCCSVFAQQSQTINSPDAKINVTINVKDKLTYSIKHEGDVLLAPSPISIKLQDGEIFGLNPKLKKIDKESMSQMIKAPIYKRSEIKDEYNELTLSFKGDYAVVFRVYNEGVAYRFKSSRKKDFLVTSEEVAFNFNSDHKAYIPYVNKEASASFEEQFYNSFENTYTHVSLSQADPKRLAFLPVLVEMDNGKKICITEADLEDYPGLYLNNADGGKSFTGVFAAYPKTIEKGGHNQLQEIVKEREPFIAKATGTRNFPWRVIAISTSDKQLADSDLVYKLASPSRVKDVSWIKPGKVAWDWWNAWNIYGVDFVSGVNTETYKYYIDFASKNGIEYVILDEGWAVNLKADLMQVVPEIDLEEIIAYGKKKHVDIILWAGYNAFNRDIESICRHYAALGVKGFKIDFMDRDDQEMVRFYYRASSIAAKYKMLVDFHGAYKPTGLQRTYPNVINFEGVHGLEQMKWSEPSVDQVTYDVTIPFIRMLAGPMDYTQGAMRNATRSNYRPINSEPMSQGTRCRQLAQYIIFEAPLNMLCDNPSAYMDEPACTKFIAAVPTTWDNTISLDGAIAEYVAIARQKGNDWYVGALTNWDARELELDFTFLPEGNYKVELFKDGVNASRIARDYRHETIALPAHRKLKVSLAPGGGYVARIYKAK